MTFFRTYRKAIAWNGVIHAILLSVLLLILFKYRRNAMIKKKLLNALMSGIVAFSIGAPSVLAATPALSIVEQPEEEPSSDEKVQLSQFIEEDSEEIDQLVSDLWFSFPEEKGLFLLGEMPEGFELTLSINDEEKVAVERSSVHIEFSTEEFDEETTLHLSLTDNQEKSYMLELHLDSVLELFSDEYLNENTDEEENLVKDDELSDETDTEESEEPESLNEFGEESNTEESLQEEPVEENNDEDLTEIDETEELGENTEGEDVPDSSNEGDVEDEVSEPQISLFSTSRSNSLVPQRISNGRDVNYTVTIGASGFSMDTLPWGYNGYQRISICQSRSSNYSRNA